MFIVIASIIEEMIKLINPSSKGGNHSQVIKIFRVMRVIRLFKLFKNFPALR